jgi:hypothetical protein
LVQPDVCSLRFEIGRDAQSEGSILASVAHECRALFRQVYFLVVLYNSAKEFDGPGSGRAVGRNAAGISARIVGYSSLKLGRVLPITGKCHW